MPSDALAAILERAADRRSARSPPLWSAVVFEGRIGPAQGIDSARIAAILEHMFDMLIEEYATLTASELDAAMAEAELMKREAEARLAAGAAIVSARGSFRDGGHRSMRSYLKATLNCSGTVANRIRRRAALVNEHPEIGEALLAGHVGVEQVDRLASAHAHPRAGGRFAEFASLLLGHAEHLEFNEFTTVVDSFVNQADPDGAFDDQRFHSEHRTATVRDDHGCIEVHATGGDALAAAEMARIFELAVEVEVERDFEARRAEFGDDALSHPLPRSGEQRRFDALHQIFTAWATVPADGVTPEPLVNIVFDHISAGEALFDHGLVESPNVFGLTDGGFAAAEADLAKRRCQTSTGTAVHPDVALRALISGRVRRVVTGSAGVVVDMGRTQRLFTGKSREAAQLMVTACSHRGCDIPATLCDVDHRAEWVRDGGPTDQANASPMCGAHDRWKHANRIRTRRAINGRVYLIGPDGTTVLPVGAREPAWAEPPPADLPTENDVGFSTTSSTATLHRVS
jgi:hypothetical protein